MPCVFREEQRETLSTYTDLIDGRQVMAKTHIVSDRNIFTVMFSDDGLCTWRMFYCQQTTYKKYCTLKLDTFLLSYAMCWIFMLYQVYLHRYKRNKFNMFKIISKYICMYIKQFSSTRKGLFYELMSDKN